MQSKNKQPQPPRVTFSTSMLWEISWEQGAKPIKRLPKKVKRR